MKRRKNSQNSVNENPHKGRKGIKKVFFSLINSFSGLSFAFKEESAFRQELFLSIILIPLALFLPATFVEKILMIGSIMVLLIIELINSSIEAVVDRISLEHHDLSKKAKDLGSAAVFISLILVFIIYLTFIIKYW
jgi:diacylglycerol kinase (ATP)